MTARREILRWLMLAAVLAGLSYLVLGHARIGASGVHLRLIPFSEYPAAIGCLLAECPLREHAASFLLINGLGNIAVFVPLGMALFSVLVGPVGRRESNHRLLVIVTALGSLYSLACEIMQLWIPGRVTAVDDVLLNSLGTALGAVIMIALRTARHSHEHPLPTAGDR